MTSLTVLGIFSLFELISSFYSGVAQSKWGFFSKHRNPIIYGCICFAYMFLIACCVAGLLLTLGILPPLSNNMPDWL